MAVKVPRQQPQPGTEAFNLYVQYLKTLEVNGTVVVCSGSPHYKCYTAKVTSCTATDVFAAGFNFSRQHGGLTTKQQVKHFLLEPTVKILSFIDRKDNEDIVINFGMKKVAKMSDEHLDAVCAILKPYVAM